MKLAELLLNYPMALPNVSVTGVKLDSRQIANGDLFIAVPGYQTDGRDYIDAAVKAGAVAVFAESEHAEVQLLHVPIIRVPNLRAQLSAIAGRFFAQPSQQLELVGVTGTNGKTSVTHIIAQLQQALGMTSGVIGTTGSGLIGCLLPEQHTTPDAVAVQQRLSALQNEGARLVAMEVSSHALVQKRVAALNFAVVAVTNISRDHLDYHGTMEAYAQAKKQLFAEFASRRQVLNVDDPIIASWMQDVPHPLTVSCQNNDADIVVSDIEFATTGARFTMMYQGSSYTVRSPLLGAFNIYNIAIAVACLVALGQALPKVLNAVANLQSVPGRMERFGGQNSPLAVVDYAHTPDALKQVLQALRQHCDGQLWCVFGCGGDRDRGKRPQMGAVAAELADQVVVTDDNPRNEAAEHIVQDILAGMVQREHVRVQHGREQAVRDVLKLARPGDVVLLAGKGHEDYQVVGRQRLPYHEREVVAAVTRELEQTVTSEVNS